MEVFMALQVTRGDYEEILFTVNTTPASGVPRDITNDAIRFSAKEKLKDAVPLVTKASTDTNQIVKTNPPAGQGKVILQPADLSPVDKDGQILYCDLVVTDSTGRPYTTRFTLEVLLDVTG